MTMICDPMPSLIPSEQTLKALLQGSAYQSYSYAYPHKSAYRSFTPPVNLETVWAEENRRALFLYVHIPFCTMRCGFCNLFTLAQPQNSLVQQYLNQLEVQMTMCAEYLGEHNFAQMAIGGGTPTFLTASQLDGLFINIERTLSLRPGQVPSTIEVSPETVDVEKLTVLRNAQFDRISMGVQSFVSDEIRSLARLQQNQVVGSAVDRIRSFGFRTLNLDLIYGISGQTMSSWKMSIDAALAYQPEEIYIYPLYVRPFTGLGKKRGDYQEIELHQFDSQQAQKGRSDSANSTSPEALYLGARQWLREAGYKQVSMRMFRAPHVSSLTDGTAYSCQDDGMIGLGCGARSYTRKLHYSSEFAVSRGAVRQILLDYCERTRDTFSQAHHGFVLDSDEQSRRFVIQSLLTEPGLDLIEYANRFGQDAFTNIPALRELVDLGMATLRQSESMGDASNVHGVNLLSLTEAGVARSDTIGPWLISPSVKTRMESFDLS